MAGDRGSRWRLVYDPQLEDGARLFRRTVDFEVGWQASGASRERFRRYLVDTGVGVEEGGRWRLGVDRRPRIVTFPSQGRWIEIVVPGYAEARRVGEYVAAAALAVERNDTAFLAPFEGQGARDTRGRFHPFETRPSEVYRAMASPEPFEQVYKIVM
jgi:hypothetical protein